MTGRTRKVPGAPGLSESDWQRQVLELATLYGWLVYHTWNSLHSQKGFPDLVLVHPRQRRVLYRELKRDDKDPTAEQRKWIEALREAGEDAGVWRPRDVVRVARELSPRQ